MRQGQTCKDMFDYLCRGEGERDLDLPAVLLVLDDPVHGRRQAAFLKHRLQRNTKENSVKVQNQQLKRVF